tara:strand:+ start:4435 stop:4602 length:168 start_codon:yes stop_codon:yes gene_type:complete
MIGSSLIATFPCPHYTLCSSGGGLHERDLKDLPDNDGQRLRNEKARPLPTSCTNG